MQKYRSLQRETNQNPSRGYQIIEKYHRENKKGQNLKWNF
jgi:hypothetical protein